MNLQTLDHALDRRTNGGARHAVFQAGDGAAQLLELGRDLTHPRRRLVVPLGVELKQFALGFCDRL
jgi:hypothetical protein